MGEIAPPKARTTVSGYSVIRNVVLALLYLAMVPVVAAAGISLGAQYFPGPTRALLGPALEALVSIPEEGQAAKAEEALEKISAAEGRLSKVEQDILSLVAKVEAVTPATPGTEEPSSETPEESVDYAAVLGPVRSEAAGRDRVLAALTAMTLARAELLAGNRAVAIRELTLASECLKTVETPDLISAEISEAVAGALDALQRGSSTAGDYLSLAWHALADTLLLTK